MARRGDVGGSRSALQQADLAAEVTGAQRGNLCAAFAHAEFTFIHDVEGLVVPTLTEDFDAGGTILKGELAGDLHQRVRRPVGEDGVAPQEGTDLHRFLDFICAKRGEQQPVEVRLLEREKFRGLNGDDGAGAGDLLQQRNLPKDLPAPELRHGSA